MTKRILVPDLKLLDGIVAQRIIDAIHEASRRMTDLGVRHILIGGAAVGAYGHARATGDVDFLVGPEGFVGTVIKSFKPGMPIATASGVRIDLITADTYKHLEGTEVELDNPPRTQQVPIARAEALIYMKLISNRRKDKDDIVELIRLGISERSVREYLRGIAPELVDRFDDLVS